MCRSVLANVCGLTVFLLFSLHIKGAISAPQELLNRPISFGAIIASPFGDVIEIDARNGPATPFVATGGYSQVDGNGFSGIVRIISDVSGQTINLVYPNSLTLTANGVPDTMTLDSIDTRSETTAVASSVGETFDFDVGGRLHIGANQRMQQYSVTMTVTVNVINP